MGVTTRRRSGPDLCCEQISAAGSVVGISETLAEVLQAFQADLFSVNSDRRASHIMAQLEVLLMLFCPHQRPPQKDMQIYVRLRSDGQCIYSTWAAKMSMWSNLSVAAAVSTNAGTKPQNMPDGHLCSVSYTTEYGFCQQDASNQTHFGAGAVKSAIHNCSNMS